MFYPSSNQGGNGLIQQAALDYLQNTFAGSPPTPTPNPTTAPKPGEKGSIIPAAGGNPKTGAAMGLFSKLCGGAAA